MNNTNRIYVQQPFDLVSTLESGQGHRWESQDSWHWGLVSDSLVKIRSQPGADESCSEVEFSSAPIATTQSSEAVVRSYFRLDDDIDAIYQRISDDARVAEMVSRHRGLRLLRVDPWECLISFICSANSNLARIHANIEDISKAYGIPLKLEGHVRYTLPAPEVLADAGEAALRSLGLGFRAPYVALAATAVASGDLDLEGLRYMPYPEAKERLMELRGIGPKIADCVLLHSLDKLEAFPIDIWVRRAVLEWYFQGQKPPPDRVLFEWAQDYFGSYAGYAELYLFHGKRSGVNKVPRVPKGD